MNEHFQQSHLQVSLHMTLEWGSVFSLTDLTSSSQFPHFFFFDVSLVT